jgi:hypothetical protein
LGIFYVRFFFIKFVRRVKCNIRGKKEGWKQDLTFYGLLREEKEISSFKRRYCPYGIRMTCLGILPILKKI